MTDTTTAVAPINLDMLKRAEESNTGTQNVMSEIINLKVYNPNIGKEAEAEKSGKFIIRPPGSDTEELFWGTFRFNPLDVKFFYAGSIYPIDKDGNVGDDKVFFCTNEFGKFAKKSDTIALSANGKGIAFFGKGDFEKMIRLPRINGVDNQFYEKKKDAKGKPYDSSYMQKRVMVYGQFVDGPYEDMVFRYSTSTSNFGVTFKDGAVCEPGFGTFEFATQDSLQDMNDLLKANGFKPVRSVECSQIDMNITIEANERGNFLPKFEYAGLVAARGKDNTEMVEYVRSLQGKHFEQTFGTMGNPMPMVLTDKEASFDLPRVEPKAKGEPAKQVAAPTGQTTLDSAEANAVFEADDDMDKPDF